MKDRRADAAAEAGDVVAIAEELQFVVGALVRQMRSVSPARDVTLAQISVLKRLDRDGPHTVAEVARLDKISHQSVTVTVSALAERGRLCRVPDGADLRRKQLVITDDGRRLLAEHREAGYGRLAAMIASRLDQPEQDQLSGTLALLRRLLE